MIDDDSMMPPESNDGPPADEDEAPAIEYTPMQYATAMITAAIHHDQDELIDLANEAAEDPMRGHLLVAFATCASNAVRALAEHRAHGNADLAEQLIAQMFTRALEFDSRQSTPPPTSRKER